MKQPRFEKKIQQVFFDNQKEVFTLKEKKSNVKLSIFVAVCGEIQDHFITSTFETEIKTCNRFDVYACLD